MASSGAAPSRSAPFPPNPYRLAFEDGLRFIQLAATALAKDEFSKCFEPKGLEAYNFWSLFFPLRAMGAFIRYGVLFPLRLLVMLGAGIIFLVLLPIAHLFQKHAFKQRLFTAYCRVWATCLSARVRHHGCKFRPGSAHLFVANHTSFIDYVLLSSHRFPHATVAQVHGGLFGILQRSILSFLGSLSFDRNEKEDRVALAEKMRAHVNRLGNDTPPLLIFPEGTCVNNEYTVLFHKGAFDIPDTLVVPVAIKYNKYSVDPYWNTREQTFSQHLFYLMTRWFMIVDIWWMQPIGRGKGESAIGFSNRAKALISDQAGLINMSWDGYMKNYAVPEKHLKQSQAKYYDTLKQRRRGIQEIARPASVEPRRLHRSNSLTCVPSQPLDPSCLAPSFPTWMSEMATVAVKNDLMTKTPTRVGGDGLIKAVATTRLDVVRTWKHYSKLHSRQVQAQRMENSSWRRWFQAQRCPPPQATP